MKCEQVREQLLDVASGRPARAEFEEHVRGCDACRKAAEQLKATMALLGEWPEVEPSPYFEPRLRARVREEAARQSGWWAWMRKPALAAVFVLLLAVGVGLFQRSKPMPEENVARGPQTMTTATAKKIGTAVSDLQALDKNEDLYANFDVLDDVQTPASGDTAQ